MSQPLDGLVRALRAADVPVSVREMLEAHETAAVVGFADRQTLKDALAVVCAKSKEEKERFDACFDLYFARDELRAPPPAGPDEAAPEEAAGEVEALDLPLADMLLAGDMQGLAQAMEAAGRRAGVQEIRFFTQRGYFTRRILDAMGLRELERLIAAMREAGDARAGQLERGRGFLLDEARQFVERQEQLYATPASEKLREEFLERARLSALERRDFERMRRVVRRMAKRLAARHSRRRRVQRRGHLDLRRTLRRNMGHDGVPFELVWRYRKIDKPKVVAICDVSRSVSAVARFLLLFLYSLHEVLDDVTAYAFSDSLEEVSATLEDEAPERAIDAVLEKIGYRSTNYGRALEDFQENFLDRVDRHTTVLIMGDGRSNYTDPRVDILREVHDRARRVIWLNPEPKTFWGTGDSEMLRYLSCTHLARTVSTVRHLERVLDDLLEHAARGG